jgi:oligoendopeptidase F
MRLTRIPTFGLTALLIATLVTAPLNMANAEEKKVPERNEIEKQYTWAPETIFPNLDRWEAAFAEVEQDIPKLEAFKGKLGEGPETLLKFLKLRDEIGPRFEKIWVYASLRADEDTRVGKYQALQDRLRGLGVKYGQATAWVEPELTAIEWSTLEKWMKDNQELAVYRQRLQSAGQRGLAVSDHHRCRRQRGRVERLGLLHSHAEPRSARAQGRV